MAKKLTVILGAGASHSLNPVHKRNDAEAFRPPLSKNIFMQSGEFQTILHKYPLAEILASDIDRKIKQNKPGIGLEQILKDYEEKMSKGAEPITSRQFLQIPLYLNTLFGKISTHFTNQPDEYNNLVTSTLDIMDEVLFLTLNYDNLLEIPLSAIFGIDFTNESHYVNEKNWSLVKLHGSTNWYRKFSDEQSIGYSPSEENYFSLLKRALVPLSLQDEFYFVGMRSHSIKHIDNIPVYPAITVPVDGKYEINCPSAHELKAKEFISDCSNYLIIGTSGKDQDLLDLLKKNAKPGKVLVVGRGENSTSETRNSIIKANPQFQKNTDVYFHSNGFAQFILDGKLEEFLDSLT